jgi:hypothetical protein
MALVKHASDNRQQIVMASGKFETKSMVPEDHVLARTLWLYRRRKDRGKRTTKG